VALAIGLVPGDFDDPGECERLWGGSDLGPSTAEQE
jgi:hypothetical protein